MEGREELASNPFSVLFPTLAQAESYVKNSSKHKDHQSNTTSDDVIDIDTKKTVKSIQPPNDEEVKEVQELNTVIEEIFLVTLNKFSVLAGSQKQLVFLSTLAEIIGPHQQSWLDLPTVEQALFERLMLTNPGEQVVTAPGCRERPPVHLTETRLVPYLVESYRRCSQVLGREGNNLSLVTSLLEMRGMVVQNLVTAFREPDLYSGQKLHEQLCDLVIQSYEVEPHLLDLMDQFASKVREEEKEGGVTLESVIHPVLESLKTQITTTSMILFSASTVLPLQYLLRSPHLARILILHSFPRTPSNGVSWEQSLLGSILSKSCLPPSDTPGTSWDYFSQPSSSPQAVHSATEARIWAGLESVHAAAHLVFKQLLKVSEEVKHLTLLWLGECLAANSGRGKMWTSQMGSLLSASLASDGFMLSLGSALLRFCCPGLTGDKTRMSKVDPTYPAKVTVVGEDSRLAGVHMRNLPSETCLVASPEGINRETSASYTFSTEVFFLTHKALDLGYKVVQEKFVKLNQELGRLQAAYRDSGNGEAGEQIQTRMEDAMQRYLSLKAALLEPVSLGHLTSLLAATADWLVEEVVGGMPAGLVGELDTPPGLHCVPEFLVENMCEHLLAVRRFCPAHLEQSGGDKLGSLLTGILCLMDQPNLLRNPHLRARLAESLECLLPHHETQGQPNMLGSYQRQALFETHTYSLRIAEAVLHVFVSIEETGQAVEFEQKFSYRRPMYDVIKYIWGLDVHKEKVRTMAEHAEEEIESENPPLFLRFLNLLINDAIFLLDEGLGYMRQIQEQEAERNEDTWTSRPAAERAEAERGFQHVGLLARHHNLMGGETIGVLEMLTSSITAVISHPTIADRLAAMLNYFLKTLTGPERKSFKVSNLDKYGFKPAEVVSKISQIYLNLMDSNTFVAAVSSDGRSYSSDLFSWTETVLIKVGRADLASSLAEVSERVARSSSKQLAEEELLSGAPDEFLCPIMSILMTDPVTLPSSKQTVDRSTIARHLLSDQSDPFNRAPLTMDMVIPDLELKEKVSRWVQERRSRGASKEEDMALD